MEKSKADKNYELKSGKSESSGSGGNGGDATLQTTG